MFSAPMLFPPISAWSAPAMSAFLWTPIWTPAIVAVVILELLFVAAGCGALWYLGAPRFRRKARPLRTRARRVVTAIREVRPRRRAA